MTEPPNVQIDPDDPPKSIDVRAQDDAAHTEPLAASASPLHSSSAAAAVEINADPLLIAYLSQRSEPCPSCRYDLRGLHGRHCPECGQELRLRVGLEHPNLGSYIFGLVALASAAGFNLLMFVFFTAALVSFGRMADLRSYFISTIFFGLISIALLLLWIIKGGAIRRKQKQLRITLAVVAWLVPLLSLLGMLTAFRIET